MTGVLRRLALVAAGTVVVVRPDLAAQAAAPLLLVALLGGFLVREARAWAKAGHETGAEQLNRVLVDRAAYAVFGASRPPHPVRRAPFNADAAVRGSASRPLADD